MITQEEKNGLEAFVLKHGLGPVILALVEVSARLAQDEAGRGNLVAAQSWDERSVILSEAHAQLAHGLLR